MKLRAVFLTISVLSTNLSDACCQSPSPENHLAIFSVSEVLSVVSDPENRKGNPAIVKVVLKNGVSYTGSITSCQLDRGSCTLVASDATTTYLNVSDVAAVTIQVPGDAKISLQGNKIFREPSEAVPSYLSMSRDVSSFPLTTKLDLPESIREDESCRFVFGRIVASLGSALKTVNAGEDGKSALTRLSRGILISHRTGSSLVMSKIDGQVTIAFDCLKPLEATYESSIAEGLNRVL